MLKRVCAIVVIVLNYNPVLYRVSMRERFVFPRKQALVWEVWIYYLKKLLDDLRSVLTRMRLN